MPTLMVSVSGIRGIVGDGLDPNTLVKYSSAYADFSGKGKIVMGRDSRITGEMVKNLVTGTLQAKGFDVVDLGICPTPTVLFNTKYLNAAGGIAITASHNPNQWNALKLLNAEGEFMTKDENAQMMELLESSVKNYSDWENVGKLSYYEEGLSNHIDKILSRPVFDIEAIKRRKFKVLLDCVNGAGAFVMPEFLEKLGCEVIKSDCEKNGIFPRLPEPIPENLTDTIRKIKSNKVDLGIVVDPDVDRLVLITEKGEPFGEEYTVAQAVRFITQKQQGNVVVNLSTTRAVDDIASGNNCHIYRSAVGEANVVSKMKEVKAVIGGEGSGGVIYPEVHYGRDALTGSIMILQHLLEFDGTLSQLKNAMPQYRILKDKIDITGKNPDKIINKMLENYSNEKINTEDGLRIDFDDHWVHLRKSNTEPIIRCITEAKTLEESQKYMGKYFGEIKKIAG